MGTIRIHDHCEGLSFAQVGKFSLSEALIREQPGLIMELLSNFLVVGCTSDFATRTLHYTAICANFEEVPIGHNVPAYKIVVTTTKEEEGYSHSFSFGKER